MQRPTHRLRLSEIGPHVKCVLCLGYLIDATTIVECLHSFCRSCLLNYLSNNNIFCPICDVQIHKTNPLLSIKPDKTLQDIVYKLVPGLFRSEMRQRRLFYAKHPQKSRLVSPEERGVGAERVIYSPDDTFSLSMEYYDAEREREERENSSSHSSESSNTDSTSATESTAAASPLKRYLQCPALVTIGILKKFIRMKFDLTCSHRVEVFHRRVSLANEYTLMDVAYIYTWKGSDPMRFFYRISEVSEPCVPPASPTLAELKTESPTAERPLLAEPSTSKEPDAKPSTSTALQPTLPKPPPTSSPGPKPSAIMPSSDSKPPGARAAETKPSQSKATSSDSKPCRTAAAELKPAKASESRASTSRACSREASRPLLKTRPGPDSQPGKGTANDKTPETTDRKPGNCVTAVEAAIKDRRPSRATSDSSDSGPVVDKKALFNSLKLKRCSEPVAVTTEKRREDAGSNAVGFASSVKGAVPSTKEAALSTKDASPSVKGAAPNTIGTSPSAKGTASNIMGATPSVKGILPSTISTSSVKVTAPNTLDLPACVKGAVPKTIITSPSIKGAAPSSKETVPSAPSVVPTAARAGHGLLAASVPSMATSAPAKPVLPNTGTGTNKTASTSTAPTSLETAPTPTSSAVPGSNAAGQGPAAMGPTASLTAKKPHQQILTNNEEIIKTPVRRPAVPMTMPGEALKRKLAALEMSQRRPPAPAKKPRLALKLPGTPSTAKPGPAQHKPGPPVNKPGPSLQKPNPAIQKPGPTVQKPSPTVQKPSPVIQKPSPAVQKPGSAVQKPGPAVQKPVPAVQKPGPAVQKPGPAVQKPGSIPAKIVPGPTSPEKASPNAKAVLSPTQGKPSPPAGHKHMPASVPKPGQSGGPKASPVATPKQSVVAEMPSTSAPTEKPSETAPRPQANEHRDIDKQRASTNQRLEVDKPRASTNQLKPETEKTRPLTNQPRPDDDKTRPLSNQPRPEVDKPRPPTNQPRADAEKTAAWANRQQGDVEKASPSKSEKERPVSVSGSPRLPSEATTKPASETSADRLSGSTAEKEPGLSEAGPSRLGKNHTVNKKSDEKVTSPLPQLIEIPKPRQDRTGALDLTARPAKCPRPAKPFAFPHPLKIPNLSRLPTPPPAKARRDEPTFPPAELSRVASPLRDHRRGGVATGAGPSGGRGLDEAAALRQRLEMQARLWGAGAAVPPEWFQMQDPSYVKHFETLMKSLAGAAPPSQNAAAAAAAAAKKLNR